MAVTADPPAAGAHVDPAALARLLHKYRTLAELRRARARGEPVPEKAVFKALAGEFPGALHELDRLPMDDIEARGQALAATLAGAPAAPWMTAMATYHALYRAALHLKARARKARAPGPEQAAALAAAASRHAGIEVGPSFVLAVLHPPGGRVGAVVLAEVAARAGQTEPAVREAMFPARRDFTQRPAASPARPAASPARPAASPARPAASPARPAASPARPAASPARPAPSPARPAASPARNPGDDPADEAP